jgi:hypothetical protein
MADEMRRAINAGITIIVDRYAYRERGHIAVGQLKKM